MMDGKLVEIGVILAGSLNKIDESAAQQAIDEFVDFLKSAFPELRWRLIQVRRPESVVSRRTAPSVLLQQALEERDQQHWDFAFVLTSAELDSHYSNHCLAALSRPLDAAVFSLSLIDPQAIGQASESEQRVTTMAHRLSRLMLHALGHLLGLSRHRAPDNLLYRPAAASELDAMQHFSDRQIATMRSALVETADQRLEERSGKPPSALAFTVRSAWINAREIGQAIVAARPWQFPRRLSGLTLASASTLVVLLMTAESWDLSLSQDAERVAGLAIVAWIGTTAYVVVRQQLIVPNVNRRSEQIVVTTFSAVGIVFTGMLVTWLMLAAVALAIACLLFGPELIASWATSSRISIRQIGLDDKAQMAAFSASLGLMIGALGTSFESQHYFRHVIFVDDEI